MPHSSAWRPAYWNVKCRMPHSAALEVLHLYYTIAPAHLNSSIFSRLTATMYGFPPPAGLYLQGAMCRPSGAGAVERCTACGGTWTHRTLCLMGRWCKIQVVSENKKP